MVFKYINMPKLVAHYLKEFNVRSDETVSYTYKFLFCLCLPFLSQTFRRARLIAYAIASCTNSQDQIERVLNSLTLATFSFGSVSDAYFAAFSSGDDAPDFPYNDMANEGSQSTVGVPYVEGFNEALITVQLNGESKETVEAYLNLLIPFYIKVTIRYI